MPLSESDKEGMLATITIELERMFTIISNSCATTGSERARYFAEIEAKIKALLAEQHLITEIV